MQICTHLRMGCTEDPTKMHRRLCCPKLSAALDYFLNILAILAKTLLIFSKPSYISSSSISPDPSSSKALITPWPALLVQCRRCQRSRTWHALPGALADL